jgi:phosphoglycolate phosphatase-like HAD superfamily hydrolase
MKAKLLLFDIDGTLLLTDGAGSKAMFEAGKKLFGETFNFDLDLSGKLDNQIFAELCKLNSHLDMRDSHNEFRDTYLKLLEFELTWDNKARLMPGVTEVLAALRREGKATLGLLTGNYQPAAWMKLKAVGIEASWFHINAFGDEAPTRPDLVALAMQRYKDVYGESLNPREIVVIGDTPRDVACAQAHGCVAFAVATGRWTAEQLRATKADIVVESLIDVKPLLELV